MAASANTPQNYSVSGQAPLDAKLVFKNKQEFFDLKSQVPTYAFNFYKGMLVYFETEEQMYVWELIFSKFYDENDRIDENPFTYPADSVYNGLDYSNKVFNLIEVPYNKENIGSWDVDADEKEVLIIVTDPIIGDTFQKEQILNEWPTAEKIVFVNGTVTGIKLYGQQIQLNQEISLSDWEEMTYEIWDSTPNFEQQAKMLVVLQGEEIDYSVYAGKVTGNSFKELRIVHAEIDARFKNSMYFVPTESSFDIWVRDRFNVLRKLSQFQGFSYKYEYNNDFDI